MDSMAKNLKNVTKSAVSLFALFAQSGKLRQNGAKFKISIHKIAAKFS